MALALFDLDNTLLAGDSDYLWNCFLVDHHLVDEAGHRAQNDRFYADYEQGRLDVRAYQRFQLQAMARIDPEALFRWRDRFVQEIVTPIVLQKALHLVESHRRAGDRLVIITATNRFVTEPIAALFNVHALVATEPQWQDGRLTGDITGIPCYQHGKVLRMLTWLNESNMSWQNSWCYSDSHNDLPLLEQVSHPVAVNPDVHLSRIAQQRQWTILDLRG